MIDIKSIVGKELLFVGGDLSGIQKFLYNITSKKAAVSLKGRSAYIENIINDAYLKIKQLPQVQECIVHDVYSSGGKFYIITSNTENVRAAIDNAALNIESDLWKEHHGQLSIHIGYIPFSFNSDGTVNVADSTQAPLGRLWQEVNKQFAILKTQRFKHVVNERFDDFFTPIKVDDKTHVCAITGIESMECVKLAKDSDDWVLPSVKEQVDLGQRLRNEQNFKTFEEYAGDSYLGVLRMDVDGLGKVFITGFSTFNEYIDFSHLLSDFFNRKLPSIQSSAEYKDYLNVIYAGGDDMFVVGRWDKVIDFAFEVRNAFINHVDRKGISISGGLAIVSPKFPIAKAAQLSGDAEDAAKKFRNGEKNAFNMFGQSLSWDGEFSYVRDFKDRMVGLCTNCNMPRSILHRLMVFSEIKKRGELKYVWNTAYYLTRFKKGKDSNVKTFCDELKQELLEKPEGGRNYELMSIAARWAELILKDCK